MPSKRASQVDGVVAPDNHIAKVDLVVRPIWNFPLFFPPAVELRQERTDGSVEHPLREKTPTGKLSDDDTSLAINRNVPSPVPPLAAQRSSPLIVSLLAAE